MNGRNIRARNPVLMSMQNNPNAGAEGGSSQGLNGAQHAHILNPLSN